MNDCLSPLTENNLKKKKILIMYDCNISTTANKDNNNSNNYNHACYQPQLGIRGRAINCFLNVWLVVMSVSQNPWNPTCSLFPKHTAVQVFLYAISAMLGWYFNHKNITRPMCVNQVLSSTHTHTHTCTHMQFLHLDPLTALLEISHYQVTDNHWLHTKFGCWKAVIFN